MDCHSDPDLTKEINDSTEISVFLDEVIFSNSIHGDMECIDCHTDLVNFEDDHEENLQKVQCAECHDDAQADYDRSVHSPANAVSHLITANCNSCHGYHNVLPSDDVNSPSHKTNIQNMCADCHSKPEVLEALHLRGAGPASLYENSVHSKHIADNPDSRAPTCSDCHNAHLVLRITDPECPTSKINLPSTCGNCHEDIYKEYSESIHWKSLERGHFESPGCNDCHGEHDIISPDDKDALTNRLNLSSQICQNCHSSKVLMSRFGLDAERMDSYLRSYHGLSVLKGSADAATCNSCHETHAIKSRMDSSSSVHPANLSQTCAQCHNNVTPQFAKIDVHPINQESRNPVAFFFKQAYIWLIVLIIGGMVVHNGIIYVHHVRIKRREHKLKPTYQRFRPWEVYQHMGMFLSFFILVVTGFALKFPEADWVQLLTYLGLNEALRSLLHRIAAVVMTVVSLIQMFYFIFSKNGRRDFKALIPTRDDITNLWKNLRYFLGKEKRPPKFGRYSYDQKAEYLALIWGVIVMGSSGVVLWFPEFFMQFLPAWIFETSEVIHYYEAWLATLAIIIWHWFFVVYHPEKYPMDVTWMDGKISMEDLEHEHSLEYEEIINENKIDKIEEDINKEDTGEENKHK
jgi:cytochrome b subunit of formate dehydrogenase